MQRWTSEALAVPPRTNWQRADLEFEGVEHDGASFVMHVFLNNPGADEATPRTPEQRYAGYLTVFAHGDCWGDVGHCDIPEPVSAFDRRPPHPLTAFNATLEIHRFARRPARRNGRDHRDRARVQQERRRGRRAPVQGADPAHLRISGPWARAAMHSEASCACL